MFLSRWLNYVVSLPTLFFGIKNFIAVSSFFLFKRNNSKPITLEMSDGVKLKVYTPMDVWTAKEVYLDKDYQRHSVSLEDGWTVLDIGAAFGDFVVSVAKHNPKSKIYGFEPFPKYFNLIKENVKLNKLKNVTIFSEAVGARTGTLSLYIGSNEGVTNSTSSKLAESSSDTIVVPSRSLEQIFKEEKIKICDYLKADCEGGEYDIFFNTSDKTLSKIRYICMEYHDKITKYNGKGLAKFLRKKGFEVRLSVNPYRNELGFLYARNKTLT
jgi:FkbM family methyltransferase